MTRRDDFMLPWGREDVGMLSLKRHEKEYSTHRQWLKSQKAVVSSGGGKGSESLGSSQELFNSGKKAQLRLDRQREVDNGNHKMVESMADTLRKGGPTMQASGVPYQRRTEGAATINRRKAAAKIEAENRLIADRLRNHVAPVIDRQKHAAEYEKATAMRRNISAAAKRADRTALARRRAADALMASSAPASLSGGGLFDQHGDYAHGPGAANAPMLKSMGSATGLTQVRTAQDVRATVAAGRGEQLPEWLTTSKSAPRESRRQKPRGAFSLSHTGAPAAPVMHPPPPIPM